MSGIIDMSDQHAVDHRAARRHTIIARSIDDDMTAAMVALAIVFVGTGQIWVAVLTLMIGCLRVARWGQARLARNPALAEMKALRAEYAARCARQCASEIAAKDADATPPHDVDWERVCAALDAVEARLHWWEPTA